MGSVPGEKLQIGSLEKRCIIFNSVKLIGVIRSTFR